MYQVSCQYSGKIFIARTKRKKGVRLCRTLPRSGFSKTALNAVLPWFKVPKALCASTGACAMYTRRRASGGFEVIVLSQNHIVRMYLVQTHCSSCAVYSNRCRRCSPKVDMLCLPCYTGYTDCKRRIFA